MVPSSPPGFASELAMERHRRLRPHLEDGVPLARLAEAEGPSERTLRRWLAAWCTDGIAGLERQERAHQRPHARPRRGASRASPPIPVPGAAVAQFERERIAERAREGLEAARKRGLVGGRPPALTAARKDEVRRMRDEEGRPVATIAQIFQVSAKTVRRAWGAGLDRVIRPM